MNGYRLTHVLWFPQRTESTTATRCLFPSDNRPASAFIVLPSCETTNCCNSRQRKTSAYHTIHNTMIRIHSAHTMKYTAAMAARIMMAVLVGMVGAGGRRVEGDMKRWQQVWAVQCHFQLSSLERSYQKCRNLACACRFKSSLAKPDSMLTQNQASQDHAFKLWARVNKLTSLRPAREKYH